MHLTLWILVALAGVAAVARWLEPRLAFVPLSGEDATPREFGVAYEAVTLDTSDGERLRGWMMSAPNPRARIVYFHGNGGNLSNWAPILAAIVKRGYSVFAIDYRGYGMSSGRPTERGLYRDVDATLARVWRDAQRASKASEITRTDASAKARASERVGESEGRSPSVVYWGRSLGGSMAAYAATVRRPDGLILESAFPDSRAVVRRSPVLMVLSLFASYRFPTAEFVNRTTMPVLQLHGDRDGVIPFAVGHELSSRIREPKTFVVIRGGDHNDASPPDPTPYWTAIDGFVNGLRDPHR